MKVFMCWSGDKSKKTAEALSKCLRMVLQATDPWISTEMEKGSKWPQQLNEELETTKTGIICLNKENLNSEWILFKSGALSKANDALVCTFLLDIESSSDIKPPLGFFQHTLFTKEEVKQLFITINNKIIHLKEKTISAEDLDDLFEKFWPELEESLNEIKNQSQSSQKTQRSDRELLEEILQSVRSININNLSPSSIRTGIRTGKSEGVSHNLFDPHLTFDTRKNFFKDIYLSMDPDQQSDLNASHYDSSLLSYSIPPPETPITYRDPIFR